MVKRPLLPALKAQPQHGFPGMRFCWARTSESTPSVAGAEFLRTRRLPDQSLRNVVGQIIGGAGKPDPEVRWTIRHRDRN